MNVKKIEKVFDANFTEAILDGAVLGGEEAAVIQGTNFDKASFRGAMFILIALVKSSFKNTIFDGAFFGGDSGFFDIDLTGASFKGCDLTFPKYIPPDAGYLILPNGQMLGEKK